MAAAVTFTNTSPRRGMGTGTCSSRAPASGACLTRAFIVSTKVTTPRIRFVTLLLLAHLEEYDKRNVNSCPKKGDGTFRFTDLKRKAPSPLFLLLQLKPGLDDLLGRQAILLQELPGF